MALKILLVEDEPHKHEELTACLQQFYGNDLQLSHVESVHDAFWAVSIDDFDLVILDMALPTFSTEGATAQRGLDQAQGGVEVLRTLKSRGIKSNIIIITQYPDIAVGGKRLKLASAATVLSQRYDQNVIGGILYKYRSPSNNVRLTALLKKAL
jgi:CheY-like chemotaxis protein